MKKLNILKAELAKRGITSLQLCQDLAINPSAFSFYLNGWRRMPDERKKEVADYLRISPSELFDDWEQSL